MSPQLPEKTSIAESDKAAAPPSAALPPGIASVNTTPAADCGVGLYAATQFKPMSHYENFPVASLLLPARLRGAVQVIYAFARSADDIADEGDADAPTRLAALHAYEAELDIIGQRQLRQATGQQLSPLFDALAEVIERYNLPLEPFYDLLSAFRQDIVVTRYQTFEALRDYCARSASPVGRLMLHLYGAADTGNLRDSDAICSALQLINFIQDVALDWRKQRIYLPLEDLQRFGVNESDIAANAATADDTAAATDTTDGSPQQRWSSLLSFEVERARNLMLSGAPLAYRLPGRIGWELRLVIEGGLRILERIEHAQFDVFRQRPVLAWRDWIVIALHVFRKR